MDSNGPAFLMNWVTCLGQKLLACRSSGTAGRRSAAVMGISAKKCFAAATIARPQVMELPGFAAIIDAVARSPGAIGYVGAGFVDPRVRVLAISNAGDEPGSGLQPGDTGYTFFPSALSLFSPGSRAAPVPSLNVRFWSMWLGQWDRQRSPDTDFSPTALTSRGWPVSVPRQRFLQDFLFAGLVRVTSVLIGLLILGMFIQMVLIVRPLFEQPSAVARGSSAG